MAIARGSARSQCPAPRTTRKSDGPVAAAARARASSHYARPHMDVGTFCAQSRVLIVAGKGGVGKTTMTAALARMASLTGRSVLIVKLEGKAILDLEEKLRLLAKSSRTGDANARSYFLNIKERWTVRSPQPTDSASAAATE